MRTGGVAMRTSQASTRPLPSARGNSFWAKAACNVAANWTTMAFCWSAGKTLAIRWMVCTVSGVCRVASTRWPVSAAISAVSIVSRSRISPTTITSGSCRNTWTSASRKLRTSVPTSCWTMMLRRLSWTNSTGSSIVTILARRLWLITSIMKFKRRRLARAGRAGHQDQAVGQAGQFLDDGRQPQFGGRANGLFAQPNGQLGTAGMKIDTRAKAAHSFPLTRKAKLQSFLESLALPGQQQFVDQVVQRRPRPAVCPD